MPKFEAKDYIRVDGPGQQTITSLAYWLTSDGINPITAELIQKAIDEDDDAEFAEAFDGASKVDARAFLERWELSYMPYWSGEEVARVIAMSGSTRNAATALRAITLAQQAGELAQAFTPRQGVLWAMARGYMLDGDICQLVGVQPGQYGHPHNSLSESVPVIEPSTVQSDTQVIPPPELVLGAKVHRTKTRIRLLDSEITRACENVGNNDYHAVWTALTEMALAATPPFTGEVDAPEGIAYNKEGKVAYLSKDALRQRIKKLVDSGH